MDTAVARQELYEVMTADRPFEWKADRALALGEQYLGVENGHLTEITPDSDHWKAIASTDPPDGQYPTGLTLDLTTTYCRRTLADGNSIALHNAPQQGWADDPAFDAHGLHCYHGTPIHIDGELYGTVCFVSETPREEPFSDHETLFAELVARLLEHELQRQRTAATIERLEQFASVLAHDLRNPLAVAHGRIELAGDAHDGDHLAQAATALDRIQTIIDDVLTMARQGPAVEETEEVQLATVAEQCWAAVATADATLTVEDDLLFRAAPDRLRHLFENLFRNAIDHGDDSVTIRVGSLEDAEGWFDRHPVACRRAVLVVDTAVTRGDDSVDRPQSHPAAVIQRFSVSNRRAVRN